MNFVTIFVLLNQAKKNPSCVFPLQLLMTLPTTLSKLFPSPPALSDVPVGALDVTEDPLWSQVLEVEATPALNMVWAKAEANRRFLSAIRIDAKNVVSFESRTIS